MNGGSFAAAAALVSHGEGPGADACAPVDTLVAVTDCVEAAAALVKDQVQMPLPQQPLPQQPLPQQPLPQ